ncbi:MAG: RNA-binding protein [Bacteroidales bacterium]|nr:RNA-binding protein [Bacteroidales bacterium]
MKIFVAKLSPRTSSTDLEKLFSAYGEVKSAKVVIDRETGNSKCFGFVEMADEISGQEAIKNLNDKELNGKRMVVKESVPKE